MEQILAIISLLLGGLGVYFFNKAKQAGQNAVLGETKGEDKQLQIQEKKIKEQLKLVENRDDSKLTDEERAKRWD